MHTRLFFQWQSLIVAMTVIQGQRRIFLVLTPPSPSTSPRNA
jgi:hypothetical protein